MSTVSRTSESAPLVTSRSATLMQGMVIAVLLAAIGWVAVQMFVVDGTLPAPPIDASHVDEAAMTARLVAQGLVPAATLQPGRGQAADTARLAAQGLVPAKSLRPIGEQAVTRSLINRGLVPAATQP